MEPSVCNPRDNVEPLKVPAIGCSYFEEPSLEFAGGREHVSPQLGITLFGPRSLDILQKHPLSIKVGFVGSGRSIESAKSWLESCVPGVEGDENNMDFPGFQDDRGFFSKLIIDNNWVETITQHEMSSISDLHFRKDRFKLALEVVSDKVRILSQKDSPPQYIILAFPDEMLQHCKTAEEYSPEFGRQHVDFRRSIKAEVMRYHLPTQIILKRTSEALPESRNVDHKSKVAWNLFTSLYFKAGGIPWSPNGLRSGTCYVGISFYRPKGDKIGLMRTSVAQAFDEHGNGLVLRGQDFSWDKPDLTPHLDEEKAKDLVDLVLKRYEDEMKHKPSRVVIHKTSKFWPEEGAGFQKALRSVRQFDLISVSPTSEIRLFRAGMYPPLRGTRFSVGGKQFLYTTGFVPALKAYPHGHIPSPLQIEHFMGDSSIEIILQEILLLTKMNWNSASFAGLLPITLKFAMRVGEIMMEIPSTREPLPQFKYYM